MSALHACYLMMGLTAVLLIADGLPRFKYDVAIARIIGACRLLSAIYFVALALKESL